MRGTPSVTVQGDNVIQCIGDTVTDVLQNPLNCLNNVQKTYPFCKKRLNGDLIRGIQDSGDAAARLQCLARQTERGEARDVRRHELQTADLRQVQPGG